MGEWAWAAGICPLIGPWRFGAVQYVLQREGAFDARKQLDFLSRHRVCNVFATPTAIRSMMGISDAGTGYPQEFRVVCSAGEPLNPEAIRWFREQYGITVLADGYDASDELGKEISAYVRDRHSAYAYPRLVEFVEDLPKTPTGKIRRIELRLRALEDTPA